MRTSSTTIDLVCQDSPGCQQSLCFSISETGIVSLRLQGSLCGDALGISAEDLEAIATQASAHARYLRRLEARTARIDLALELGDLKQELANLVAVAEQEADNAEAKLKRKQKFRMVKARQGTAHRRR